MAKGVAEAAQGGGAATEKKKSSPAPAAPAAKKPAAVGTGAAPPKAPAPAAPPPGAPHAAPPPAGPPAVRPGAKKEHKPFFTKDGQAPVFPQHKHVNKLEGELRHFSAQRQNTLGGVFEISEPAPRIPAKPKVLVVDIGGSNVKLKAPGHDEVKFPSGSDLSPASMVNGIREATRGWKYDVIAIGYPGVVKADSVHTEPKNLGKGWVGFDFSKALGKPVKMVNDAAMQALGSATKPGVTLFLGVGTGLGVALVVAEQRKDGGLDKRVIPTELGHAHASKHTDYESLVSKAALDEDGRKKWQKHLVDVVTDFKALFNPDAIVIGGGNVKKVKDFRAAFPDQAISAGDNDFAFAGGEAMWGH